MIRVLCQKIRWDLSIEVMISKNQNTKPSSCNAIIEHNDNRDELNIKTVVGLKLQTARLQSHYSHRGKTGKVLISCAEFSCLPTVKRQQPQYTYFVWSSYFTTQSKGLLTFMWAWLLAISVGYSLRPSFFGPRWGSKISCVHSLQTSSCFCACVSKNVHLHHWRWSSTDRNALQTIPSDV